MGFMVGSCSNSWLLNVLFKGFVRVEKEDFELDKLRVLSTNFKPKVLH